MVSWSSWGLTKYCVRDRKSDFRKLLSADDNIITTERGGCRGSVAYDLNLPGSELYDPLEAKALDICSNRPTTLDLVYTDVAFPVGGRWLEQEDGSKLFYASNGELEPEEYILLLHGMSEYSAMWDRFTDRVLEQPHKKKLRLISLDFYGSGRSIKKNIANETFDIDFYCKQVHDVLVASGAVEHITCKLPPPGAFPYPVSRPKLTVVGYQVGAAVAVKLANSYPELISRVVLCSPVGLSGSVSKVLQCAASIGLPNSIFKMMTKFYGSHSHLSKRPMECSTETITKQTELQEKNPGLLQSLVGTLRDFPLETMSNNFKELGTHKHIRILLLWGRHDLVAPFHLASEVRSLLGKQCTLYSVDAGSNVVLECPEVAAARLISFLAANDEFLSWKE